MTCKDCAHYTVCAENGIYFTDEYIKGVTTSEDVKDLCPRFKNRTDFVGVVRCRNCKYHHWEQEPCHGKTEHFCSILKKQVFADFYCYYGANHNKIAIQKGVRV